MSSLELLEQYPNWKTLLTELLAAIAKRLTSIEDYASFRGVCTSWRCAATFHNFDSEFPRVPRLIYFVGENPVISEAEESEEPSITYEKIVTNFLDLESNASKIVNFPPPPDYSYISYSGWILCISNDSPNVSLKHSMLGITIKLPDMAPYPIISKMVLSGSPINDDVLVMVIWGMDDQLAFCRPGDNSWTVMDWGRSFYDIIYYNNKLYALEECSLRIVECDIHGSNPTKIVKVFDFPTDEKKNFERQGFLVESSGKFLMVLRYSLSTNFYEEIDSHHNFRIIEIELNDGSYKEIDNLGNRCIFLGLNSSICVEFPSSVNLKRNCIYYANGGSYCQSPAAGVYTLCDGRFGMLECFHPRLVPPVWVVPGI